MATGIKISDLSFTRSLSGSSLIPIVQDGQTLATSVTAVAAGASDLESVLYQGNTTTQFISTSNDIIANNGRFANILSAGQNINDIFDLQNVTDKGNATVNSIKVASLTACGKIIGGINNTAGIYASVVGGECNNANGSHSTIGGGKSNITFNAYTTIAGGYDNVAYNLNTTVGGGKSNCSLGVATTIAGGKDNYVYSPASACSFIGGGYNNCIGSSLGGSTIAGGCSNKVAGFGFGGFIGGGNSNCIQGTNNVIAGGQYNYATGTGSSILGGVSNTITHDHSFITGSNITSVSANMLHATTLYLSAAALPTSDPNQPGVVWNDSGTLKISQ